MLIIATFSQVGTLSRSGHIKIFHPWRINMYILPLFMDEVLREEIVKKDNEIGGNIPGGNFPGGGGGVFQGGVWGGGGVFPGRSLMGGNFPWRNFPRTYYIIGSCIVFLVHAVILKQ